MSFLTRAQIDAAGDLNGRAVEVPEWGGSVFVRVLSIRERLSLEEKADEESKASAVVRLVALAMCGEDRKTSLFGEDGIEALQAKSTAAFFRVRDVALEVNGITGRDVEDLEKN